MPLIALQRQQQRWLKTLPNHQLKKAAFQRPFFVLCLDAAMSESSPHLEEWLPTCISVVTYLATRTNQTMATEHLAFIDA